MPFVLAKNIAKTHSPKKDPADSRRSAEHQSALSQPVAKRPPLGQDLKAARLGKQIALEQVAADTHISLRHFQSLEEGRYRDLPGGMYNRAFLRSYCVYLGFDADEYLSRYEEESVPPGDRAVKTKARAPQMPAPPLRIPPLLIWSVMLLVSVVGLYFSRRWITAVFSPYFSHPPSTRLVASPPLPPPQVKASEPSPAAGVTQQPEQPAAQLPPDTEAVTAKPTPPAEELPGKIHLEFHVLQACWISVISDGTRIPSKTLLPGQDSSYNANERFEIRLGNAGGVNLIINGKPAKSLGKPGSVLNLLIDAQSIPGLLEKTSL
jgi:cytoskeleton protein RodZ